MTRSFPLFQIALRCLTALVVGLAGPSPAAESGIHVVQNGTQVGITWPISAKESGGAVFNLDTQKPLIELLGIASEAAPVKPITAGLNPITLLTVGERDLK